MSKEKECPLCGGTPTYLERDPSQDAVKVECERCGRFVITETAKAVLKEDHRQGLSSFCRRSRSAKSAPLILSNNIEELLKSLPRYSPTEKLETCLN